MEASDRRRVEIISTTMVKPSSPTPNDKRRLRLSLLDQTFSMYGPMIYCYNTPTHKSSTTFSLQKSLSKALELFYPFAGRFSDDFTAVECNDHGAYFLEAKISSKLSDFLRNPDPKTVGELLPSSDPGTLSEAKSNNIVALVQLTLFSCGGIAIAVEVSHNLADAFSASCFAKTWAALSAGNCDVAPPVFVSPTLLPPPVASIKRVAPGVLKSPLRSRRFCFNAAKLADLKKTIQGNGGLDFTPSTLEAVSSLLFKCVAAASGESALLQMVNLRTRLASSLPENCIGNFAWPLIVSSGQCKQPMELHEIATIIRKGLSEFFRNCKEDNLKGEALVLMVSRFIEEETKLAKAGIDLNWVSFVSSLRLYEMDFGWGEPAWTTAPLFFDKCFPVMHSKSGQEIEVWATLEEHVMAKFESNEELLAFVSVDIP